MRQRDLNVFSSGAAKLAMCTDRISRWAKGEPIVPVTLEIQPSEQCNHHCPACQAQYSLGRSAANHRARSGAYLDLRLLDSIWESPPDGIVISGNTGDPLLHPDIVGLLQNLEVHNLPVALISNGQEITEDLALQIVRTCRGVRISLDAYDAASFLKTHGVRTDAWFRVLQGISMLIDARGKLGIGSERCLIGAGFLTGQSTVEGMQRATLLARSLELDYIQFRPFHYDATDIAHQLGRCEESMNSTGFRVLASNQKYDRFTSGEREYSRCHAAWFYTVLDARGDLYLCCHHVGENAARLGSLHNQSWVEFVHSRQRREIIENFTTNDCVPLCRLDTENEFLHSVCNADSVRPTHVSSEVKRHQAFV